MGCSGWGPPLLGLRLPELPLTPDGVCHVQVHRARPSPLQAPEVASLLRRWSGFLGDLEEVEHNGPIWVFGAGPLLTTGGFPLLGLFWLSSFRLSFCLGSPLQCGVGRWGPWSAGLPRRGCLGNVRPSTPRGAGVGCRVAGPPAAGGGVPWPLLLSCFLRSGFTLLLWVLCAFACSRVRRPVWLVYRPAPKRHQGPPAPRPRSV